MTAPIGSEPHQDAESVRCSRCGGALEIVKLMYGSIWSHIDTCRQFCRCPNCDTLNDPDFPSTHCDYCGDPLGVRP